MQKKTNLEDRLVRIEKTLESLVSGNPQQEISKEGFLKFYNKVKFDLINRGQEPIAIYLSKRFSDALKNVVLYPAEDSNCDFWFVIGELSPIPIAFISNIEGDYNIDYRIKGTFKNLEIV